MVLVIIYAPILITRPRPVAMFTESASVRNLWVCLCLLPLAEERYRGSRFSSLDAQGGDHSENSKLHIFQPFRPCTFLEKQLNKSCPQ